MHDEDYANKAAVKTKQYEAAGYRQHKNLIITYEADIRMPEQIEEIARRFLLIQHLIKTKRIRIKINIQKIKKTLDPMATIYFKLSWWRKEV